MKNILHRGLALLLCLVLCLGFIPSSYADGVYIEELLLEEMFPDETAENTELADTAELYSEDPEWTHEPEEQFVLSGLEEVQLEDLLPEAETEKDLTVMAGTEITQNGETPEFDLTRVEEALLKMDAAWSEAVSAAKAEPRREEPEAVRASNKAAQRGVSSIKRIDNSLCIVRFYSEKGYDLVGLSVTDAAGKELEPAATGDGWSYLLDPGAYTYRYHDDRNIFTDIGETSFTVDGDQEIPLTLTASFEDHFDFHMELNPLYEGLIVNAPEYTREDALDDMIEWRIAESERAGSGQKRALLRGTQSPDVRVRNAMASRQEEIVISFYSDQAWTLDNVKAKYAEVFKEAIQHTGNHWEGDTLSWAYWESGYSSSRNNFDSQTGQYRHDITFIAHYRTTAAQEEQVRSVVNSMVTAYGGLSDYEKAYAINEWLYMGVNYDYDHEPDTDYQPQYTDYAALIDRVAVCQGYAISFYRLALAAGLDARIVTHAYVVGGKQKGHAWNIVDVGSAYYELDATWDSNRRQGGTPESELPYFFLRGSIWWQENHKVNGDGTLGDQFDPTNTKYYDPSFAAYALSQTDGLFYVVSYNANGGDTKPDNQTKASGTALTLTTALPTRTDTPYTLTLDANGGGITNSSGNPVQSQRYTVYKLRYTFEKWNTEADGSGTSYNPGDTYSEDANVELFAQWRQATLNYGLPTPVWEGHVFIGWGTSRDATTGITGGYKPTGDETLYAVWEEGQYVVSYNANGGSSAPGRQAKIHGTDLTLTSELPTRANPEDETYTVTLIANGGTIAISSNPMATGVRYSRKKTVEYSFLRWNTKANGSGTNYNPGDLYTENADLELFAGWSVKTTIQNLLLPTPTWEGHVFIGWGTSRDATTGVTGTYTPKGSITLYAVWIEPDLILPAALTTIEEEAFMGGAFTFVKLSDNTASIGARAFAECPNLAYICMPSGVTVDPTAIPENVTIIYCDPAD